MPTKKAVAKDLVDRVRQLRTEGDFAGSDTLRVQAETAIAACRPQDRGPLAEELADVFERMPAPEPASADLAIRSWRDVDHVEDIVNDGVRQVKKAVSAGLKTADMARQVAATLLDARLEMRNAAGLPDIVAERKYTKDIARDLFLEARKGVTEEDVHRWDTHKSLAKAVRNRMSDVVVEFLRGLDEDPDKARQLFPMVEFKDGQSATEAVYGAYEAAGTRLPRKGRTELAREDAQRRRELVQKALAGELPAEGEEVDEEELEKDMAALARVERGFLTTTRRAANLSPQQRGQLKARINEMITNLAAAASRL